VSRGPWVAVGLAGALAAAGLTAAIAVPSNDTPVHDVQAYTITDRDHVLEPHWQLSPPAGGEHSPQWLACGVYERAVDDGLAVHALEHGAVWITYTPGLDADDVADLARKLPAEGILSPYDGLPGPVVATVWGRQLVLAGPDDEGLDAFLEQYADGHTAPEPAASCAGGLVRYATTNGTEA
jgi:hypothetical protein